MKNNCEDIDSINDESSEESFESLFQQYLHRMRKPKKNRNGQHYTDSGETGYVSNKSRKHKKEQRADNERTAVNEQDHIQRVHEELFDINNKLQEENIKLREWDNALSKREKHLDKVEKKLNEFAGSLQDIVEKECAAKIEKVQNKFEEEKMELHNENKKMKNSLKILKRANETLKNQLSIHTEKLKESEEKQSFLKSRISNLQRKVEIVSEQSKCTSQLANTTSAKPSNPKTKLSIPVLSVFFDSFSTLLAWISNGQLKSNVDTLIKSNTTLSIDEYDINISIVNENCVKVIMSFAALLPQISSFEEKQQIAFINFMYWSMLHLQLTQNSTKFNHSATYRRIGEELWKWQKEKGNLRENREQVNSIVKSLNIQLNLTILLILLHTLTQADIVCQVYHSIIEVLHSEYAKDVFLRLHGTFLLLPNFKLPNKVITGLVADVLMVLSSESPYMKRFLDSISSFEWLQSIMDMMNRFQDDEPFLEKMSLLLQRLSKLRENKNLFEALQLKRFVKRFIDAHNSDDEFLRVNLRSTLYNLDVLKVGT